MRDLRDGEMLGEAEKLEEFDDSTRESTLERERNALLNRIESWLEGPMLLLAFVWLALLVVEFVWGERELFVTLGTAIWAVFVVHFAVQLTLAPRKLSFLRGHWLTAISLAIPALRLLRIARVLRVLQVSRAGRGVQLVRVISSVNRGMAALGASFGRRGFGYVAALTLVVITTGAAGMYAFERGAPNGLTSYGEAIWWTAMIMTTLGSEYWPVTIEGRVLCVLMSLYAFAVFGYVTATLATFFVGRDAEAARTEHAVARELEALRLEIGALRRELQAQSLDGAD